ncbi:MAG: ATP-binding protein [Acidimicrobiia bacterium]
MTSLPNRAPIAYDDLRRPYNTARAAGAAVFVIGVLLFAFTQSFPGATLLAIPAFVVVVDGIYRRTRGAAFIGLVIDATAIGLAMVLRGPAYGVHAVAIITLVVSATLLLALPRAAAVVFYGLAWSAVSTIVYQNSSDSGVAVDGANPQLLDVVTVTIFFGVTAWVLFLSVRVILAFQDRQAEALATERRAVQLKNEFVSMVSHELRTPLTGIAGFTETLSETWTTLPSREVDEFLRIMGHETDHLANLVEDILVIPRLEAGQLRLDPESVDLTSEVHTVADIVFLDTDYSVAVPAGVDVYADRTRLRQIMRNLLENAKKYGGDQVLVEGELSSPGLYTVSVSDNGPGIATDDTERIFQHFEQLSSGDARIQQGVGLGLPIARKLARAMGGDLWYEDRFPVGSKFRFTIPLTDGREQEDREDSSEHHDLPGYPSEMETGSVANSPVAT